MKKNLLPDKVRKKICAAILCLGFPFLTMAQTPDCLNYGNGNATGITYYVNGNSVASLSGNVYSGDTVKVCFQVNQGCTPTIFTLVSYSAPGPVFDVNTAHLQTVYDVDSMVCSGSGIFCLEVVIPNCYFQIDFVKGCVIYQFGPGNFYSTTGRLITGTNGGNGSCNCMAHANAGADFKLKCYWTEGTLYGSTYTHGPIIQWYAYNGGNIVSGANTLTPTINAAGTYVLAITDSMQCTATDTVIITGHTNVLTPGVIGHDQIHCGPFKPDTLISVMDATANPGETITYQWLYSYVDTPNTYGNPHWVAIPGANQPWYSPDSIFQTTHYVRCARTIGCTFIGYTTESEIVSVYILEEAKAKLGNDTIVCAGESVTLDAGYPDMLYYWSTGETTRTITVTTTGNYYVTTIKGNCTASDTIHVTVLPELIVDLGPDTTVTWCSGSLILDAGNPGLTYLWSTGEKTQTISVSTSGTYYATVTNQANCTGSDTINVTVNQGSLTIDLGNDTSFVTCKDDSLLLDAGVQGATYMWSTGATTQSIYVDTSGTYYVDVIDSKGCFATDTIVVTITNGTIHLDFGPDTTVCGCIELNAYTNGASFYQWCSGGNYPSKTVCYTGTYCVTVRNGLCVASDTIYIVVNQPPAVFLGNDTVVMSSLILNAGNPGAYFMWSTGETTQTITATASGFYSVTVTDVNGCTDADTIFVNVLSGIAKNSATGLSVTVYPNPSNTGNFNLNFTYEQKGDGAINIMNALGSSVYYEKLENFQGIYNRKINKENFSTGIYFIEVVIGNEKQFAKIIIK